VLPSTLQEFCACRYSGDELNMPAAMKLLRAFQDFMRPPQMGGMTVLQRLGSTGAVSGLALQHAQHPAPALASHSHSVRPGPLRGRLMVFLAHG
jgi:hypothetical protein